MRTNGFLYIQRTPEGEVEVDDNGIPIISANPEWSTPIPCAIKTNTRNNKGVYRDGKFEIATYEILIEAAEIEAKRVRLEMNGKGIGEFVVQDIQELLSVGRVKILV